MTKLLLVLLSFFWIVGAGYANPNQANSISKQLGSDQSKTTSQPQQNNTISTLKPEESTVVPIIEGQAESTKASLTSDAAIGNAASKGGPIPGDSKNTTATDSSKIVTITSEAVPGADCTCIATDKSTDGKTCIGPVTTRKYECTTNKGMLGFQEVFAKIIRYVINIVLLLGVLAVVGLGIAWSFAGGDDVKAKSTLKTWAINIVIGLLILFMFRYILLFLAPWIYR